MQDNGGKDYISKSPAWVLFKMALHFTKAYCGAYYYEGATLTLHKTIFSTESSIAHAVSPILA